MVNKYDGDLIPAATRTAAEYRLATQLQRRKTEGWKPPVTLVSALTQKGVEELWTGMLECHDSLRASGVLQRRRDAQVGLVGGGGYEHGDPPPTPPQRGSRRRHARGYGSRRRRRG